MYSTKFGKRYNLFGPFQLSKIKVEITIIYSNYRFYLSTQNDRMLKNIMEYVKLF